MNNIPKHYYEAAEIDGASSWKKFWNITLPLLTPTLGFVTITTMIGSFQVFDQVYVMTKGGPLHICGIHDYYGDGEAFLKKYRDMDTLLQRDAQRRKIYADGYAFAGQPIILSEFGGIAFGKDQDGAWGYNETANSKETLLARIRDVTQPIVDHPRISGYCYTQLTDVMQEINGLADANHAPKLDADKVRKIFENPK